MDSSLVLRIALSFVIAGTWIALSTLAGERLGSRIGGLVGNLPSNILVSMLFTALTRGTEYAASASASVPLGMVVDTLFLLAFIAMLPRGLVPALTASFAVWGLAALAAVRIPSITALAGYRLQAIGFYIAVMAVSFLVAEFVLRIRAVGKKPSQFRFSVLIARALFAGTIVAATVSVAQFAPPLLTGIIATFPAVLTSTMVILTRSQGIPFARATGKVLILSSANIIVYSTGVGLLFPAIGPWWGTLASFSASVIFVSVFLPLVGKIK